MNEQPEANQVPLVELLAAVPADIRIGVDDGNDWKAGTTWHPIGLLCHDAAAELRRLDELAESEGRWASDYLARAVKAEALNAQLLEALEWIANRCPEQMLKQPLHTIHREAAYDAGACARAAIAVAKDSNAA